MADWFGFSLRFSDTVSLGKHIDHFSIGLAFLQLGEFLHEQFDGVADLLILFVDVVTAVQEVVLQAFEQIPWEVCLGFTDTAMYTNFPETLLDNLFVASIREMDRTLFKPCCRPTDRVCELGAVGMVTLISGTLVVLPGDLTKERIDYLTGYNSAGM